MAGQGMDRREVLRAMAIAAAASGFPGFQKWAFAHDHARHAALVPQPAVGASGGAAYTPQFFTAAEYATLERLTELIIPSDGSPGAREAGVAEFIDFMVWSDAPGPAGYSAPAMTGNPSNEGSATPFYAGNSLQYRFRYGLNWLDNLSQRRDGAPFTRLSEAQQVEILDDLAFRKNFREGEDEGRAFFNLLREYTLMGFYTSRVGLEALGYPGLQVVYDDSPACPHPGHQH